MARPKSVLEAEFERNPAGFLSNSKKRQIGVSVIVPALDEERVIGRCLNSLARLRPPRKGFEVVLVDNGSKDRTLDIARAWSAELALTVLKRPGASIPALRNAGAALARGEVLAFLDADCVAPAGWLRRGTALLAQGRIGVLGAHYRVPEGSGWVARAWYGGRESERKGDVAWVPGGCMLMSRAAFRRLGGFDEGLRTSEDCELCERARRAGLRVAADAAVAVTHLGTPRTLGEFYRKTRWQASDGLRVFLRCLPGLTNPRPLLFGAAVAACAAGIALGAASGRPGAEASCAGAVLGLAAALAARLAARRGRWADAAPLTLLHLVYGLARAHALLAGRPAAPPPSEAALPRDSARSAAPAPPSRKVLMLSQYLHVGGLERLVLNLSKELKSRGDWEPQVYVYDRMPGGGPEDALGAEFAKAGIPVTSAPKPPRFSVRTVLALRRKLSEEGIPVLHTHDLGALIYGACAKLLRLGRVRLVHTQHSFVHLARRPEYRLYERLFAGLADEVAVASDDARRTYAGLGVSPDKLHVVPHGAVFPSRGPAGSRERARLREELCAQARAPARRALGRLIGSRWLLYLARLHRTKGQDRALELWSRLPADVRARAALVFVGPESEPGALLRLRRGIEAAPDRGRIVYAGTARRPERWLLACDAALSCSEHEGMPLGPIEAAGAGLPLVLSDIPGHGALKGWSRQYPLSEPGAGARLVERALAELEAGPERAPRRAWDAARGLRARHSLSGMGEAYARLYRPREHAA